MKNYKAFPFLNFENKLTPALWEKIQSFSDYLSALLNSTQQAIFLLDVKGNFKLYNEAAKKMILQFTGSDIGNSTNLIHAVPEWRKASVEKSLTIAASGNVVEYEVRYPDGQWLEVSFYPVGTKNGGTQEICCTLINITARKKNHDELKLLSQVIKETSNIVVITDKDEKIIWANNSFRKISEYSLQEALNHKPGQLLGGPEKDVNEVRKIKKAILSGKPVKGEILNYSKTGKKYWTNYNIHPVRDEKGNIVKYFSIQADITELKKVREQITFAAVAAHEERQTQIGQELHDNINQILAVTKIYLAPLLNGNKDTRKKAEPVNKYIQLAIDEIRKLSHRLVAPRFKEQSLEEVLKTLIQDTQSVARVNLNICETTEDKISAEIKLALYRIVQEQFNNISKHAKAKTIDLEVKEDNEQIVLTIVDDGNGFEVKQTKKGIGITNIYNRAESLNGNAEIISAPGKGCKLIVSIPLSK